MKAKELISNFRTNLESSGSLIKGYTDQHVMYMLDKARSILASQKLDTGSALTKMVQTVDVIVTPTKDLGSIQDVMVLKVVTPTPVTYNNGVGILTVGPIDGGDSYAQISFAQLRTVFYRKHTGYAPKWLFLNGCIYIVGRDVNSAAKVRVQAVFEEPYKVEQVMGRYKYLDPFNFEYPLSTKDEKPVYQLTVVGELGWGDTAARAVAASMQRQEREQNQEQRQEQNQEE
jgi:hypothetical protein